MLPGNLCKLEIGRLGHEDEGRSLGPLKGLQLGYGSPSTSIQGHMIPDSDGEVKLMKAFIIYKVFPYPYSLLPL